MPDDELLNIAINGKPIGSRLGDGTCARLDYLEYQGHYFMVASDKNGNPIIGKELSYDDLAHYPHNNCVNLTPKRKRNHA